MLLLISTGGISTDPVVDEVKQLLLRPLHMIVQSLFGCVQPLTSPEQKTAHFSRPESHASTLLTSTDMHSTTQEGSSPIHTGSSPIQKSVDAKQQV